MKILLLLILNLTLIQLNVYCQGTLIFSNIAGPDVDAPVTNAAGNRIIGPAPYVADLFWSSDTNAALDSLSPAAFNQSFLTTTFNGGGYFNGGTRTLPGVEWILAQVRVWDSTYGATYTQARDNGGEFGSSNPILVYLTLPPGPGGLLTGLHGFQLGTIPEPSSLALAFIGGAALFFYRRRARR